MPGDVCSLSFSSCSLNAKTVVAALELWTMESCVPGHHTWLEEEEGTERGLSLQQCTFGGSLFSDPVNISVC